jgi:ketosteroid isomerase-like protein
MGTRRLQLGGVCGPRDRDSDSGRTRAVKGDGTVRIGALYARLVERVGGLPLRQGKGAALFHVRGGKVTRLVVYIDRARGLSDLALAAEAESPSS